MGWTCDVSVECWQTMKGLHGKLSVAVVTIPPYRQKAFFVNNGKQKRLRYYGVSLVMLPR